MDGEDKEVEEETAKKTLRKSYFFYFIFLSTGQVSTGQADGTCQTDGK